LRLVTESALEQGRASDKPLVLDTFELVAALRQGDATVAAAFHDQVRPVVDRTILRILGRRDRDHDDIAQVVLVEIIRSIDRFRGECSLDGWVAMVAAHTVYKHLRRRKTEARIFAEADGIAERPDGAIAQDRRSALRACMRRVRDHLDAITPQHAWAFLLHDVCGYDLQEIARITEVSIGAAQKRLSRGRSEILARLRQDADLINALSEMGIGGES
jgi:RNA polymerase sigma-70 factor (ECF subfamily)